MTQEELQSDILGHILSREQRQKNTDALLKTIQPEIEDFNIMLLGFTDIIQGSFLNFLLTGLCKTEEERQELRTRMNTTISELMQFLNEKSSSNPEDMVILSTVMVECISKAINRQAEYTAKEAKQP